jgi:hypothetical protein
MEKKCTKCKEVKSLDEFSKDKRNKDGKQSRCKSCQKEYNIKNKDKRKAPTEEQKERRKKAKKIYREKNRERLRESSNNWSREKLKTDPLYKLRVSIRTNIGTSLRKNGYTKENKTYNILKCEYDFFMEWINGIASNGYQYGFGGLHLDHVVPMSLAQTEEEAILLCHYSNYQLLNATENVSKGNRYVNPVNLARVLEHHPNPDKIREIHARL